MYDTTPQRGVWTGSFCPITYPYEQQSPGATRGPYSVTVKHMHGPKSLKARLCFNMRTAFIMYGRIIQTSELLKSINKAPQYN